MRLKERLSKLVNEKQSQGLLRYREVLDSAQGTMISIDGRQYLSFCSNDYLGLANDKDVARALAESVTNYGVGSGAAHLITGHSQLHHELEHALAEHVGRSKALLFSTGYMANLGLLTALGQKGDLILEDKLNHASLIDGGMYSAANFKRYQHLDLDNLALRLSQATEENYIVVTDSVFSMDGDMAPLPQMLDITNKHDATLIVDDAHGLGVLGVKGGGICEHFNISENDAPIIMATLGKALGVFGAFVAGSKELIDYLIQTSRSYIYTTAMPSCLAAASLASLEKVRTETWRREKLSDLILEFKTGCQKLGLNLLESNTPIQPILLGDSETALHWSNALREQGILVKAIRPPTVPVGTARLRVTLSAAHDSADIRKLLSALEQLT